MGVTVLREEYPTARKDYTCDACQQLLDCMVYPEEFTEEEVAVLAQAEVLKIYFKYDIGEGY